MIDTADRVVGVMLGTAVGDAIGLPFEGMSRRRVRRLVRLPLGHQLVFGRGMTSDDTEHTCLAAQALLASHGDTQRFARSLGWRLRFWLLGLPAGVGKATAQATIKLWLGFPPTRSGVSSAGNGPAMRAAILGAYAALHETVDLKSLVAASTRITHTDDRAESGSLAIALAARYACGRDAASVRAAEFAELLGRETTDAELLRRVGPALEVARSGGGIDELAEELGLQRGVSGFVHHTVPVALFCWFRWPGDFRAAVEAAVLAGGDTDSTAAIVGGLVGATTGEAGVPREWLDDIAEWPRTVAWMRALGRRLAAAAASPAATASPLALFWPGLIVRNIVFLAIVLLHGFRRLLPPY